MVQRLQSPVRVGFDYTGFLEHVQPSPYRLVELMRKNPTEQQRAVLDQVEYEHKIPLSKRKKRFAITSGQGTGKTSMMGWLQSWRTLGRRNGLGVHTAPTGRQCRDAFLADLNVCVDQGDPILRDVFKFRFDRIHFFGEKQWAIRTMTAQSDINLQGQHRENLTASIDEGSGVGDRVYEQFEGTLSNEDSMLLVAGNPNLRECYFYRIFYGEHRDLWHRYRFDGELSPIASKDRNRLLAEEYGIDSDVYRVRVKGLFPRGNPDAIIMPESLELAMSRFQYAHFAHLTPLPGYQYPVQIGLDFAWMGDHESVLAVRENRKITIYPYHHIDPDTLVRIALEKQRELGVGDDRTLFCGDAGGVGGPAMRKLSEKYGKNTYEFHNGGTPSSEDFKNQVTEGWFILRRLLKEEAVVIQQDDRLRDQLLSRTYKIEDASGKVKVVDKNKHIANGGPSPDRAEAVLYACYDRTQVRSLAGFFTNPYQGFDRLFERSRIVV